jgi:hypothetical protein
MTAPGRREAAQLLLSLDPPEWFLRHSCAVADVAGRLAAGAAASGRRVDVALVEAAALLHDVDKLPSVEVPGRPRHGDGSAEWLAARGLPELGPVVRDHPVTRLAEPDHDAWMVSATLETKIVAYADKRAAQRLEAMDERFASWRRRYPPGSGIRVKRTGKRAWDEAMIELVVARAAALEREVCAAAGIRPGDLRRLRWSRRALREAAR